MIKIARDIFQMVVTQRDPVSSFLKSLSAVRITVYKRDTTTMATIYRRHDGTTQGPAAESAASGGPNPFITGDSGQIEFWCDGPDELDVAIEDTIAPARIPARRIGWNVFPASPGSVPGNMLATDAQLALGAMAPSVVRQLQQIGQVIDWWRPNATVPIPSGFEICDGRQIPAGSHDFPGLAGAAINLPDLRNMFILGAVPSTAGEGAIVKAHGAGAGQTNAPGDAPGIAGTGGTNAPKNFGHGHGVPGVSHQHLTSSPDHLHSVGSLYTGDHSHGAAMGTANRSSPNGYAANSANEGVAFGNHIHSVWTGGSGAVGIGGNTGAADRALAAWSGAPNVSLNTATNSLTWTEDPGGAGLVVDMRPRFIGLLKLMKVRRS